MRDPLDSAESAYEILGLEHDATRAEINAAYARQIRNPANAPRRQQLTMAWQMLRKTQPRMEEDFWHYPGAGASVQADALVAEGSVPDPPSPEAAFPDIPLGREFTDLADDRHRSYIRQPTFRDVEVEAMEHLRAGPELPDCIRYDS